MELVTNNAGFKFLRFINTYIKQNFQSTCLKGFASLAWVVLGSGTSNILSLKVLEVIWIKNEQENLVSILDEWVNEAQGLQKTSRMRAKTIICGFFDKNENNLNLSNLGLNSLPEKIFDIRCFQRITTLDLRKNRLESLPLGMGNLSSLQVLQLSYNCLQDDVWIPLSKLTGLTFLNLNCNKIKNLPTEIGHLQFLQKLYLCDNQLERLPLEMSYLHSLQDLRLSDNQLQDEVLIPLSKLSNLTILELGRNKIKNIFPEIGRLQSLQELYFHNNQLESLSSEMGNLSSLQILHLSDNQLQDEVLIPLSKLTGLTFLDLNRNKIKNILPEIGHLQSLQELYLSENQLERLPSEIGNLSSLQTLILAGNNIDDERIIFTLIDSLPNLQLHPLDGLPINRGPIYKGFLYRILDSLGEEKGYLAGSLHDIPDHDYRLDFPMLNGVRKAQAIIVEVNLPGHELSLVDGVEKRISSLASINNKKMYELETLEFQRDLLDKTGILPELESLKKSNPESINDKNLKDQFFEFIKLMSKKYQQGEKSFFKEKIEFLDEEDTSKAQELFFNRNLSMADKIDQFLRKQEFPFILIGAMHLWGLKEEGKKGVVALLRNKGWTVKRV